MDLNLAKAFIAAANMKRQRALYEYLPYGHPDTLWPDGAKCVREWTNNPWQLEFHRAGADNSERLLMAANGCGKTWTGAAETAIHLTGDYPDWWEGKRFDGPIKAWIASISNEGQRDYSQPALLGPDLKLGLGTGLIPKDRLEGKPSKRQCGIDNVADEFHVKHRSGGLSTGQFKVYTQGWEIFQGGKPNVIWADEQMKDSEHRIFTEMQTRIFRSGGILYFTLTPMRGETRLTEHFVKPPTKGIYWIGAVLDDAPHVTPEDREHFKASLEDFEYDARVLGLPMLGEGRIFMVKEEDIKVAPFEIPDHWFRIAGVDFGSNHPAAGAWLAVDRDTDVWYLYDCYRKAREEPIYHAAELNRRGDWIPVAWPHDGENETAAGAALQRQYKEAGANLLGLHAHYKPPPGKSPKMGAQPVEPIITEFHQRMRTGGFKAFSTCAPFWEEFRSYHRVNGKPAKVKDDVLKAMFYAGMMERKAIQPWMGSPRAFRQRPAYTAPVVSSAI